MAESKRCEGKCGLTKPVCDFKNAGKKADGSVLRGKVCKACNAETAKERRAAVKSKPVEEEAHEPPRACAAADCCKGSQDQPATAFEKTDAGGRRKVCKVCRKGKRAAAEARDSPATKKARAAPPERCCNPDCEVPGGRPFSEADFDFRTDSVHGAWRPECRKCGALGADGLTLSQRFRARQVSRV